MPDYPEEFLAAVHDLIANWEGGYVDDAKDPGGETKYGISKRSYPNLDIKGLSVDAAVDIYYRDFWVKPGIDSVGEVYRPKVFNIGALIGPPKARELLVGCDCLDQYKQVLVKYFEAIVIRHPVCAKYLGGWKRRALA
jgi:hypothetical protein